MLTFSVNKSIDEAIREGILPLKNPTTQKGKEWWSVAVFNTLEGKASNVNLDAYGYKCDENTRMVNNKKEVALLTVEDIESGQKGVADSIASYLDTNIDTIIEFSEVKTLTEEFIEMYEYLLIEEGVDLWKVFCKAREGYLSSIEILRQLVETYNMEDFVNKLFRNSECMKVLEGSMGVDVFA